MSKTLIIAEKPSVAQDIVRALTTVAGKFEKLEDHFENERYVVSSAVGHLVEITAPEEYDVKRGKWSFANLPVVPPHFDLAPIDKAKSRLNSLVKLVKRKDVTELINACDAGREGELIFRLIVQYADNLKTPLSKPIRRLWLQSMTPQAIRDGFDNLRSDQQMLGLADAARSRSEADWLVGINGTRAMTAFNSRDGGFFLTTVGRVQTPTLSIMVEREEKIRKHVSRDYWEIKAGFLVPPGPGDAAGSYEGKWFDPKFKKGPAPGTAAAEGAELLPDPDRRADRLWNERDANLIRDAVLGKTGTVSEESKPSSSASPLLYDLTTLQREANSRFGFSAKTTLSLAQALYEKHKVLTYPRTDSRALPEDYVDTVKQTFQMIAGEDMPGPLKELAQHARKGLAAGYIKPTKRVFDNSKVSDHFAIIPTLLAPKSLTEIEAKLYDMVVKRFIAVFYPSAEFQVTTRITKVEGHHFQTNGKVLVNPGWLAVYGKEAQDEDANLVPVQPNEAVTNEHVAVNPLKTKPPARYTEATLLSAMEGAGKLIDDDEFRQAMAEKGLGTPATRAQVIEGLIAEKYILREGRDLCPTAKAFQLMTLLRGLAIEDLTKPELTGNWEHQLAEIEHGRLSRADFMKDIAAMAERIVRKAKEYDRDTIPGDYATLAAPCPNCSGVVRENYRRFTCIGRPDGPSPATPRAIPQGDQAVLGSGPANGLPSDSEGCGFSMTKIPAGRSFELREVEAFLHDHKIGPLEGFRSKAGWPFSAELKLVRDEEIKNWKLEFDFGDDAKGADGEAVAIDFTGRPSMGACPKCKGHVYEHGANYACERAVSAPVTCDFKTGKIILTQPVSFEQVTKLLATGKTDLLDGFVSNKTRRKFKAQLAWDEKEGKVSFEFAPRAEGKPGAPARKAAPARFAAKTVAKPAAKAAAKTARKTVARKAVAGKTVARKTAARKTAGS